MENNRTFAVIGGDLRQGCLANLLAEQGERVWALCLERCTELSDKVLCSDDLGQVLPQCSVVIFPLPLSTDDLLLNAPFTRTPPQVAECMRYISPKASLFGGMVSPQMKELACHHSLSLQDYYCREELIVRNCIPTAEGALEIAMQETAKTIFGAKCLVTGFGRVSKAMVRLLLACGAQVSVAARKQGDLAWIRMLGARAVPMESLREAAGEAEIIFNTVPVRLLNGDILPVLRRDCLIVDLASKPGGEETIFSQILCQKGEPPQGGACWGKIRPRHFYG